MRRSSRQPLSILLLAVYGGISLLGYGLHELAPHGYHDHGMMVAECDGHAHHNHAAAEETATVPAEPTVRASGCSGESHVCDVCLLLEQLRSERPHLQTTILCQHLVATVVPAVPRIISQTTPGLHSARGPPALLD